MTLKALEKNKEEREIGSVGVRAEVRCIFFGGAQSMRKFLGQGSNLCHSSDNAKSLTC